MTIPQLHLCRCLLSRGFGVELLDIFLRRCGATPEDWRELVAMDWVYSADGVYYLTREGKKAYQQAKKGKWF